MIWFYGITTIINQSILLRELANLFQSNELILNILFFSWFIGTSLGSSLYRYFPRFIRETKHPTSILLFILNLILLILIISVRFTYSFYQYKSEPNLFYLSAIFFTYTFPISFLTGAGLTSFIKEYEKSLSYIYFIEGIAAFFGGIIFTFIIAGRFDAIVVASVFILISILFFIKDSHINVIRKIFFLTASILVLFFSPYIVKFSRYLEWKQNAKLITSTESKYGYIAEVENNGLKATYYNGIPLSYYGSQTFYEEAANLPFLVSGNPQSVCIIGFAPPVFLEEIMKYKPKEITILLSDEVLAEIIKDFAKKKDMPLKIIVKDPISSLYEVEKKYDLIFIKIGLPTTIASDVFYSDFFYKRVSRLLTQDGIMTLNIPYEENNLSPYSLKTLKIIMSTLSHVFQFVDIAPAESFYFFASNTEIPPLKDKILQSLAKNNLNLKYLNTAYINHYLDRERLSEYSPLIRNNNTPVNSLFSLEIYNNNLKKWIINNLNDSWVVLLMLILAFFYFIKRYFRIISSCLLFSHYSVCMFLIGFTTISGEIMLLNYYQIVSGYLYYYYGLLTALFMLGLGFGSFLRYVHAGKSSWPLNFSLLLILLWLLGIEVLYLAIKFELLEKIPLVNILVFVWNFYGGFSLGFLFNTFAKIKEQTGHAGEVIVSELYSFDLIGSAFGALITGPMLLPLTGHTITTFIICMLLLPVVGYAKK